MKSDWLFSGFLFIKHYGTGTNHKLLSSLFLSHSHFSIFFFSLSLSLPVSAPKRRQTLPLPAPALT